MAIFTIDKQSLHQLPGGPTRVRTHAGVARPSGLAPREKRSSLLEKGRDALLVVVRTDQLAHGCPEVFLQLSTLAGSSQL